MKKNILPIIGVALQCFGIGFMLYGINNSRTLFWIGLPLVFVGLALILIGLISNKTKTK
jgi:hypothetical protein